MRSLGKGLILAFACFIKASGADQPLHQDWIGELRLGERNSLVEVKLETAGSAPAGTITYPVTGAKAVPLSAIVITKGHISFTWLDGAEQNVFEGSISNGILGGSVRAGNHLGTLQLAATTHLDRGAQERIIGYYELGLGHLLSITAWPLGTVYIDYTSGRAGVLFPSSENDYFAGPAFQVAVPVRIKARFTMDGQRRITGVHWQEGSSRELFGRKLELPREEVVFRNGDVSLSGTLTLPVGQGPHPAIVRIQGSGPQTRRNKSDGWYAYHGLAYLSFDKRGAGKSTGDWREAGLSELADDVLAGVRFLRQRSDIDAAQISIAAESEGGWVAPVVITRDPRIRSVILGAGPVLDYVSELLNEVQEGVKARGLEGEELRKAIDFKRRALAMIKEGAGLNDEAWAKFQAFVGPYRSENWFRYVSEPEKRSWIQKKIYLMSQLDTPELWRHVTIPVLALYGGNDLNVPAAKNVAALEDALRKSGNRDYTIKVFPNANHEGMETDKAAMLTDDQLRYLQRHVPGCFSIAVDWLLARVSPRKQHEGDSRPIRRLKRTIGRDNIRPLI